MARSWQVTSSIAVVVVTGCGRIDFDAVPASDATTDTAPACTSWGPFDAPVKLGSVNSIEDDWCPMTIANDTELYFHSFRIDGSVSPGNIWRSKKSVDGTFGPAVEVTELDTDSQELVVAVTEDGLEAILTTNRNGGAGGYDLWHATRTSPTALFGVSTPLANINDGMDQLDPVLSRDGLELWFATGLLTGAVVFQVARRPDRTSPFGAPTTITELGASVMGTPSVSSDGLELFFSASRAGGVGGWDVWATQRASVVAAFDTPHLVPELSSPLHDACARLSADGATMYLNYQGPDPVAGDGTAELWSATRTCL